MFPIHSVHNDVDNENRRVNRPVIREHEGEDLKQTPLTFPFLGHKFPCDPWFPISAATGENHPKIVRLGPGRADLRDFLRTRISPSASHAESGTQLRDP